MSKSKPEGVVALENPAQPYSSLIRLRGGFYHSAGLIAVDRSKQPKGDVGEQAADIFRQMLDLLRACGLTVDSVYEVEVMLTDAAYLPIVAELYIKFFEACEIKPVRNTKIVGLLFGCAIEMRFSAAE